MPVNITKSPEKVINLLRHELKTFLRIKHHPKSNGSEPPEIEFSEDLPHKVFVLTLEDIISGKSLTNARFTGWRHIITHGDRKYAADVFSDANGENHQYAGTHEGPLVDSFHSTLEFMHKHERVQNEAYELCLLKIPALYVLALWLKSTKGDIDLIVPVAPTHSALAPANPYTVKEFMDLIKGPAQQMAAFKI